MARRSRKRAPRTAASPEFLRRKQPTVPGRGQRPTPDDEVSLLTEMLNRLTPEERLIITWKSVGFSIREIAVFRGVSPAVTQTLYRRIKAKIRRSSPRIKRRPS